MGLCHEKHAVFNLNAGGKIYKGRVVFHGDQVREETRHYAVFTEQSASAPLIAAVKFIDLIGRCPGNALQGSDAIRAYTQAKLASVMGLLGQVVQAETLDIITE